MKIRSLPLLVLFALREDGLLQLCISEGSGEAGTLPAGNTGGNLIHWLDGN